MEKRFILLLGVLLGSEMPTAAQTRVPQIIRTQERVASIMMTVHAVPAPLLATSFLLSEDPGKSSAHFNYQFAGAYERDQSPGSLLPMHVVRTLFLTQSSLPLLQFWGGRLRLAGFKNTLHLQNVQLGPSGGASLQDFHPARQCYPGGPRSVSFSGLSLSFHFGRDPQIGRPTQIWRSVARIVGAPR